MKTINKIYLFLNKKRNSLIMKDKVKFNRTVLIPDDTSQETKRELSIEKYVQV